MSVIMERETRYLFILASVFSNWVEYDRFNNKPGRFKHLSRFFCGSKWEQKNGLANMNQDLRPAN